MHIKDVGMELLVWFLHALSCLYIAISATTFMVSWHWHPYIILHFRKCFFICLYAFFAVQ